MSNQASGNKYTNLISNTVIFGISTFGSKVLTMVFEFISTRYLLPEETSTAGFVTTTSNFILPIMYLCIAESVIRFAMEKEYSRRDIFSVGIYTVLAGYAVLWLFYPLIGRIEALGDYAWLVMLYCLTSAMRTVVTSYVRATGLVRVFAIDGIVTAAATVGFNLLFLVGMKLGPGYMLGTVCADGLSALGLFVMLRLHRFLKVRGIDRDTVRDMFRYALPLVPNAVFWTVTNLSDRFFVREMAGDVANGIYTRAVTIPNLITSVSFFFTRAWELSAFTEYKSKDGVRFFSNVFRSYYTFIFLVASALILLIRPITSFYAPEYFEAWRYSLFLILGVSFSCLVTFLGAVYNAARRNMMVLVTTFIGAVANLALNWLLIPVYGPIGAAFATFVSYFVVFLIRAVDTRRYIAIRMQPWRIALSLAILLAQVAVMLSETKLWVLWECLLLALLLFCNFGYLLFLARRILSMLITRRRARRPRGNRKN